MARLAKGSLAALAWLAILTAARGTAQLPFSAGVGPDPQLPPAQKEVVLTVHIAEAQGGPLLVADDVGNAVLRVKMVSESN